jgi:hypothetical protein
MRKSDKDRIIINRSGLSKTRAYAIWSHMIDRCHNPKHDKYRYYGARGINVCERWINSFDDFLLDMGQPPEGLSLDRINTFGNYEPSNCRWATKMEQMHNMRNNIWFDFQGGRYTLADLARIAGVPNSRLWRRLFVMKLPLEEAMKK